ncbi:DUF945 family protein [Sulfurospirillum arcachonense]|uniref:DUF945 family protein n=1 Tax=Sulfurospirillum arcachonense TaxID=57666 RepID=UPI000468F6DD|nr:DUF945 family protein [Sulfurospirillum arcachonense]
MKSIYMYVVGILVIVGIGVTPVVMKQQVNKTVEKQKQTMLKNGLKLTILKEEGYLKSTRDFELEVVNAKQFRDYVFSKIPTTNPTVQQLITMYTKESEKDIRPALDGFLFKGSIKNSNLLPEDIKVEMSLVKLSTKMMQEINKNKKIADLIKPLLDEKILTFFVTLDAKEKVKEIVMKDIEKSIKIENEIIDIVLKGHKLVLNNSEKIVGVYSFDTQSLKTKDYYITLNGLNYKFNYLSDFNNAGSFHLGNITIKNGLGVRKPSFNLKSFDMASTVKTIDNILNADINYDIKGIDFTTREKFMLDAMNLKINIDGLNKDDVLTLSNAYSNIYTNAFIRGYTQSSKTKNSTLTQKDMKIYTDSIQKIINQGFDGTIDVSINGVHFAKVGLKNIDLSLKCNVEKNSYTIHDMNLVNALHVNGAISMNEEDLKTLSLLNRQVKQFSNLAQKEADRVVFNLKFEQGKMFINGKKL